MEPRSTLYLIRHGESEWNAAGRWQGAADPLLSAAGLEQARELAERFSGVQLDRVFASDQLRALDTAAVLARAQDVAVETDAALRELDVGSWSGLSRAQIDAREPGALDLYRSGIAAWQGGERYEDHELRVATFPQRLARLPNARIAVVSHGGTIRALVRDLLGIGHEVRHRFAGIANCELVQLEQRIPPDWTLVAYGARAPR